MKIRIQNFQSLKDVSLEVKGLTSLTGVNNTGKSAVARAIMGLFTNARGNNFVRVGEKTCKVSIDFENGHTVTWEKGKGSNKYEINGQLIERVGNGAPEEIDFLGVKKTTVDGKDVWPQFARQFEQIFLLDLPPSVLSSALSNVEIIEKLESASDLAKSEHKSLNVRLQSKRNDLSKENCRLKCFEGLDDLDTDLIRQCDKDILDIERILSVLETLKSRRNRVQHEVHVLSGCSNILDKNIDAGLTEISDLIFKISKQKTRRARLGLAVSSLEVGLSELSEIDISYEFNSPLDRLKELFSRRARYASVMDLNLPDVPNDIDKEVRLYNLLTRKEKIMSAVPIAELEIKKITDEIAGLIKGICPLCERACEEGFEHD